MSELSRALGDHGPRHEIACNGKTYKVGLVTQAVKVGYEKKLYQHAKDAVTALRHDLDGDQYVGMLTRLTDAYEAGEFAMEGTRGLKALKSPKGAMVLLGLLIGCDEIETLNLASQKKEEVAAALNLAISESFPGATFEKAADEGDDSPKA
jgi:hypothetical protein